MLPGFQILWLATKTSNTLVRIISYLVFGDYYQATIHGGNMADEINVSINEQGQVQIFKNEHGTFYLYNVDFLPNGNVDVEKAAQTARFHMNKLNKKSKTNDEI